MAKDARDRVLHVGHAKISYGQMNGQRNPPVIEHSQHLIGSQEQSIEQIPARAALVSALAFFSKGHGGKMNRRASSQDLTRAGSPCVPFDGGNTGLVE